MRFSLKEQECRIVNVNSRAETHGDVKKPAADLKIRTMLPNTRVQSGHHINTTVLEEEQLIRGWLFWYQRNHNYRAPEAAANTSDEQPAHD